MSSSLDFIRACDDDLVPAQENGEGTIEHHPAEGWWWLSDGYGETDGFDGEARPHICIIECYLHATRSSACVDRRRHTHHHSVRAQVMDVDHYGCDSKSTTPPLLGWIVNTLGDSGGRGKVSTRSPAQHSTRLQQTCPTAHDGACAAREPSQALYFLSTGAGANARADDARGHLAGPGVSSAAAA